MRSRGAFTGLAAGGQDQRKVHRMHSCAGRKGQQTSWPRHRRGRAHACSFPAGLPQGASHSTPSTTISSRLKKETSTQPAAVAMLV